MGLLVMIDLKELHEGERDIFAHAVCIVSAGFYVGRCRGAYGDIWKKSWGAGARTV